MGSILEQMHKMHIQEAVNELEKTGGNTNVEDHQLDGIYYCRACGYIYDEAKEGKPFTTLSHCPVCGMGQQQFVRMN
ncbi:MAG: hypothetical protein MR867_00345 [Eubacterium sp.]|nr:hypothetical protein [Eubacterium sp.]MDD7208974.1 hypothetical protein [Lachnospiraceae bacterium]